MKDPSLPLQSSRTDRLNGLSARRVRVLPASNTIGPMNGGNPATDWAERLRAGHPDRERAVADLHQMLLRVARHELQRRRGQLGSLAGPELDDIANQCADDATVNVLAKIDDFRGLSRFTTWAFKFAIFEVSGKLARHSWRHHPPNADAMDLEELPDALVAGPGERAERREQLDVLKRAIDQDLTERQREVFVAVALNEVPIDVLALQLKSNRNAIYKNVFDARRRLRESLAAAGHPLAERGALG